MKRFRKMNFTKSEPNFLPDASERGKKSPREEATLLKATRAKLNSNDYESAKKGDNSYL